MKFLRNDFSIKYDAKLYENEKKYKLSETEKRFQLKYLSDYLKTENTNTNDSRTQMFKPNSWQIEFLGKLCKIFKKKIGNTLKILYLRFMCEILGFRNVQFIDLIFQKRIYIEIYNLSQIKGCQGLAQKKM